MSTDQRANEVDRKPGLLTATQREFLLARGGYYTGPSAKQQRYDRREAIKSRMERAFDDLQLLVENEGEIKGRLGDIPVGEWDKAVNALEELHPEPARQVSGDELRALADDLSSKADRLDRL